VYACVCVPRPLWHCSVVGLPSTSSSSSWATAVPLINHSCKGKQGEDERESVGGRTSTPAERGMDCARRPPGEWGGSRCSRKKNVSHRKWEESGDVSL